MVVPRMGPGPCAAPRWTWGPTHAGGSGRAGRPGGPADSSPFRPLFATGAVNWVMGKTLPDDVPLEAKMVSKAIERAQTTVEQRNGEIRKNVLKYDEVMNEQRKVIYALRDQVLDRADLRERIVDELAAQPLTSGDAAIEVASAHLYEQASRDAFRRLAAREALMVSAAPERLGIELVNRYHALKRAGTI